MGCQPRVSVVSLGLDPNLDVEAVTELYEGMLDACDVYGGDIVGGDIVSSPAIFVTVAMVGDASTIDGPVLDRSAASVGDLIGVTGALGDSAGGLRLLLAGDDDRDLGERSLALRHLHPSPRIEEGLLLRRLGVRAAMDVSDGLIADLGKMCAASGVGALIDAGCVPGGEELRRTFPDDWTDLALGGRRGLRACLHRTAGHHGKRPTYARDPGHRDRTHRGRGRSRDRRSIRCGDHRRRMGPLPQPYPVTQGGA